MSRILGAFTTAFSWTFPSPNSAVVLVLGALLGWGIRELLSLPGRPAREHRLEELMTKAASKALEDEWRKRHPGEPLSISVHDEIVASALSSVHTLTADGINLPFIHLGTPTLTVDERDDDDESPGHGERRPQ